MYFVPSAVLINDILIIQNLGLDVCVYWTLVDRLVFFFALFIFSKQEGPTLRQPVNSDLSLSVVDIAGTISL